MLSMYSMLQSLILPAFQNLKLTETIVATGVIFFPAVVHYSYKVTDTVVKLRLISEFG